MNRETEILAMDDDQVADLDLSDLTWTERAAVQCRHVHRFGPPVEPSPEWARRAAEQVVRGASDYEARNRRAIAESTRHRQEQERREAEAQAAAWDTPLGRARAARIRAGGY
jgi:hypothetical protein